MTRMRRIILFICLVLKTSDGSETFKPTLRSIKPGPWINSKSAEGTIWPKPQVQRSSIGKYLIIENPATFKFKLEGLAGHCDIIKESVTRFHKRAFPIQEDFEENHEKVNEKIRTDKNFNGILTEVEVLMNNKKGCEKYPSFLMDEHYEIKIDAPDSPGKATIIGVTAWGLLRGLESFTHLTYINDDGLYQINSTQVMDFPRFSHRGIMLDTSRHYLSKKVILDNLDLMEMNKFNVFHWHIVDDESFPYTSIKFPNMSAKGAYDPKTHVYTQEDIREIIEYARLRGIRVIPEFDTPGHTQSWGLGQPGLLTECYSRTQPSGFYGPVDPTKNTTFTFMEELFGEIADVFPDKYIHLGGDEVPLDCWQSNPRINSFVQKHKMADFRELESYYIERLLDIVESTNNGYIVWNEVFDNHDRVNKDAIIHVWVGDPMEKLKQVTEAGLRAILSNGWYLNYIEYGTDWQKFYDIDPQGFEASEKQKKLVIGGEACMWAEYVNSMNLIPRLWPRASAVGERLWSSQHVTDITDAAKRIQEMECRLLRRGYPVEPIIGANFCKFSWN